ncbi:Membrane protein TerC, possibly involved in tellurium resistance [Chitinophaga rupis]|uniref:Membrane protein TerC, possibly involved in tellurium resistance n=1 Tax=Chitinophaga rupis TaxID=573321 RepID=A0A1H7H9I6_9BACT|nr:TerC family protein [Chitinophaga rupis]SEK45972.1 Membrane protein TerC, possibly involved in tellurium resistance [Chitinophaga rupis]
MEQLFTTESLISLLTLVLMEVVLGIDNVIFVSIVMNRLPEQKRLQARRIWMFTGIGVRVILLLCIGYIVRAVNPLFHIGSHGFSLRDLIMLGGGLFLLIKTTREIHHKLEGEEETLTIKGGGKQVSLLNVVGQIIVIDTVFSFDSIITAVGLAKQVPIMIIAVIIAMIIMFLFAPRISDFIHKHPTLKMLALSFLVMVGAILIIEGWDAERAHDLHLKNYVYFAMAFSFGVEMLNMVMRKKTTKPVELREPTVKEKE